MPSPITVDAATVHVNRACGIETEIVNGTRVTKCAPSPVSSYSWREIYAEMEAQGYQANRGQFERIGGGQ